MLKLKKNYLHCSILLPEFSMSPPKFKTSNDLSIDLPNKYSSLLMVSSGPLYIQLSRDSVVALNNI